MASNDYNRAQDVLRDFLRAFEPKRAEDPARDATVPEDMKEGTPATTEVNKGDGTNQGPAGTEMQTEVKENSVGTGNSVQDNVTNNNTSDAGPKIEGDYNVTTTTSPESDLQAMDSVDASIKKAYAQNIKLGNHILNIIDRHFEAAQKATSVKTAADRTMSIKQAAEAQKELHVREVMAALGISAKQANDLLNQVAEEDVTSVLPPETMQDAEADDILEEAAAAAEADAAATGEEVPVEEAEPVEEAAPVEEAEPMEGDVDPAALEEDIRAAVETLVQEGHSEEEVAQAVMDELGITEEDVVDLAMQQLEESGLSPEESSQVMQDLAQLQEQGVTPDELAEALNQ